MEDQSALPPTESLPSSKSKQRKKTLLGALITIILIAGVVCGMYAWQHSKSDSLNKQIISLKATVSKLEAKNTQGTNISAATPGMETDTLPDGTKITYQLTSGNANIIWWTDGNDAPSSENVPFDGYLRVSDKRIVEFLSTLPTDIIQNLCSSEWDNETGLNMGEYQPSTKTLSLHNQYANCIQLVAADTDGQYATQAQQVIKDSTNDLDDWAKSITYSK
jgi:hypothetical protein